MTIHLPVELENSVRSMVLGGLFASEDELVAEAVRSFLHRSDLTTPNPADTKGTPAPSFIGSMRDAANELDEVVADALRDRREQPWRLNAGE